MTCKFRAAQFMSLRLRLIPLPMLACALLLALPAQAEKADRSKPMVVEADQPGTVDLQRQVVVFNGNVVISQGSMVLRAERVELRETTDGHRAASASASPSSSPTTRPITKPPR